jgi:hypothetical protein
MTVDVKANDNQIVWIPPQSDTDARVPTAEELRVNSELAQRSLALSAGRERPAGLLNRPAFGAAVGSRGVILPAGLHAYAPGHPRLTALASPVTVTLPGLGDTVSSVSRYDRLYLAVMEVVVTAAIDEDINFSFKWRDQNNNIQTLEKENTRRARTVWAVVFAQDSTTASAVLANLPVVGGKKSLVVDKATTGSALGQLRIYPLDPNLVDTKTYEVLEGSLSLIEVCRVWRVQNFDQAGYRWGRDGEDDFIPDYHIQPSYTYVGPGYEDVESRARETFSRLMRGLPLSDAPTYDRAVVNLTNSVVAANPDAPGVAGASPNGSVTLANDQRISFSNQQVRQTTFAIPVVTTNSGGFARAQLTFAGSAPAGSRFSPSSGDHKVYTLAGEEIGAFGTFVGLGDSGTMTWTASVGAPVAHGEKVYLVPMMIYPAGSGFPVAGQVEAVYADGVALDPANIREASVNDLTAYAAPANGEDFIAVAGRERAALHYIYKKLTLTSDVNGIVRIPDTERGLIAFISGSNAPSGRVDLPVVAGLDNEASYNVLVYYPPRSAEEWQVQVKAARYPGRNERAWLEGSQVVTDPVVLAHTQGGGTSVFQSEGSLRYEAVGMRLPGNTLSSARKAYTLDTKIRFKEEGDPGPVAIREVEHLASRGVVRLQPGSQLASVAGSGQQGRGISGRLSSGGIPVGVAKRPLSSEMPYQVATACVVEKAGSHRLLVATYNEGDPSIHTAVECNSDTPHFAAFDTFKLY